MSKWAPKTFQYDGYVDMHCTKCGRYLNYDSRLIDIKIVRKKCPDCETENVIYPPRRAVKNGKNVILFRDAMVGRDPLDCTSTADKSI